MTVLFPCDTFILIDFYYFVASSFEHARVLHFAIIRFCPLVNHGAGRVYYNI